jgi:hypothetical protein
MANTLLTDLGEQPVAACLDCESTDRLCDHDEALLPLATALANHFHPEAGPGQFLVDAEQLIDTVGPGPYCIRTIHTECRPDTPFLADVDLDAAAVINQWVVVFPPGGPHAESQPAVLGRLPDEDDPWTAIPGETEQQFFDRMATPTLTLPATDLYGLLVDLADVAGREEWLPMFNGVLLHTAETANGVALVGTATDRFLLAQVHADEDVTGSLPEVFLPLRDVRQLIAGLQNWDNADPDGDREIEFDYDDEGEPVPVTRSIAPTPGVKVHLTVADDALTMATVDVSVRIPLTATTEFPVKILPRLFTDPPAGDTTVTIAPRLWRRLAAIADRRDTNVTVHVQPTPQPTQVHIGSHFRALAMPTRSSADAPIAPRPDWHLPPSAS